MAALFARQTKSTRKFDNEAVKQAVFGLLHEPPSNYGINRTTWIMPDLSRVLRETGRPACPEVIRKITKAAGYRWRKARVVLTSSDPDYTEKLDRIRSILSGLRPDEAFFSIDEFGPFAVKMKPGRALSAPGEQRVVPQWQKSRGCMIMTAALELSGNQVTHFYSPKKNTAEMIRMMELLVEKYRDRRKLYLSWDAASWHISKSLYQRVEEHNAAVLGGDGPMVETAPLPSGAQFLNVIESVFSGMARSIIHNSDYKTLDDAKGPLIGTSRTECTSRYIPKGRKQDLGQGAGAVCSLRRTTARTRVTADAFAYRSQRRLLPTKRWRRALRKLPAIKFVLTAALHTSLSRWVINVASGASHAVPLIPSFGRIAAAHRCSPCDEARRSPPTSPSCRAVAPALSGACAAF